MKKLIPYLMFVVVTGCVVDDVVSPSNSLGTPSAVMTIVGEPAPITSGQYAITVNVTPGATYSFQLTRIDEQIVNNYGFTATSSQMTVDLDYSTIPQGAYDLVLMDNTGRLLKTAVLIQR